MIFYTIDHPLRFNYYLKYIIQIYGLPPFNIQELYVLLDLRALWFCHCVAYSLPFLYVNNLKNKGTIIVIWSNK